MSNLPLQGMWVDGRIFTDAGSHADADLAVLYPVMPDDPSWFWIALLAGGDPANTKLTQLVVRPNPNYWGNAPLSPFSSGSMLYKWGMNTHGSTLQLSVGCPPDKFTCLSGFFGLGTGPDGIFGGMGHFAFVGDSLLGAETSIDRGIWNDQGSGANDDGSVWGIGNTSWKNNGWGFFQPQTGYGDPGGTYHALDLSQIDFNWAS